MLAISIGSSKNIDFIRNKLVNEFKLLQVEDAVFYFEEQKIGSYTFFNWRINLKEDISFNYLDKIASLISEIIIEEFEPDLIANLVDQNYCYFVEKDKDEIIDIAKNILGSNYSENKHKITERVLAYLNDEKKVLILDGFIKFRLKDYGRDLLEAVDDAVDDHLMEKEYNEFISLLKYFVEMQVPKMDEVHVLLSSNNQFFLYDNEEKIINNELQDNYVIDLNNEDINYDDLLISALITIAPSQIILHVEKQQELNSTFQTITSVFGNKVKFCQGCKMCLNFNLEKQ